MNLTSYTGIDPGSRNLGFAQLSIDELGIVRSYDVEHVDPQTLGFNQTLEFLHAVHSPISQQITIERYVAYKGVHNAASEEILMIVGGLRFCFSQYKIDLLRAIEWKPRVCKYLVKNRNFDNPSLKFDKIFSMAAARCIVGFEKDLIKTDHVADAICLAYYGYITHVSETQKPIKEKK